MIKLGSLLWISRKSRCWPGSYLEALGGLHFQTQSDCWKSPVPYDCRKELPISWLAASQGLVFAPRDVTLVLAFGPLCIKASNVCQVLLTGSSLTFPSAVSLSCFQLEKIAQEVKIQA